MALTLAGNLTLVGSVANLIVAQRAQHYGLVISFWSYLKVGAPLTVLTILFRCVVAVSAARPLYLTFQSHYSASRS